MTTRLHQLEQENLRLRQFVEECREAYSELEDGFFVAGLTFQANIKAALAALQDLSAGEETMALLKLKEQS